MARTSTRSVDPPESCLPCTPWETLPQGTRTASTDATLDLVVAIPLAGRTDQAASPILAQGTSFPYPRADPVATPGGLPPRGRDGPRSAERADLPIIEFAIDLNVGEVSRDSRDHMVGIPHGPQRRASFVRTSRERTLSAPLLPRSLPHADVNRTCTACRCPSAKYNASYLASVFKRSIVRRSVSDDATLRAKARAS